MYKASERVDSCTRRMNSGVVGSVKKMLDLQSSFKLPRCPTFQEQTEDEHDGQAENVVVVDSIKVLEVEVLDPLTHVENVSSRGEAIESHPEVSNVEEDPVRGCK